MELVEEGVNSGQELRVLRIKPHAEALLHEGDEDLLVATAKVDILVERVEIFLDDFLDEVIELAELVEEASDVFLARLLDFGPFVAIFNEANAIAFPQANEVLGTTFRRHGEVNNDLTIVSNPCRQLKVFRLALTTCANNSGKAFIAIHLVEKFDVAEAALMVRIRILADVVAAVAKLSRIVALLYFIAIGVAKVCSIQNVPDLVHDGLRVGREGLA